MISFFLDKYLAVEWMGQIVMFNFSKELKLDNQPVV